MITRKQVGPTGGDCIAVYNVSLDTEYTLKTLKEFIDSVVVQYPEEWGSFIITLDDGTSIDIEYRHGVVATGYPDCLSNKKVISVDAWGGWTRMDYNIRIGGEY